MDSRFSQFPRDLASRARRVRFGEVPVLLAHPDWTTAAPVAVWLHGRTANKELDPGRYLRWVRAGIAACAIDLPGHGERAVAEMQKPEATLDVIERALAELPRVLDALAAPEYRPFFDLSRVALGGMSLGGMVTLRRLCEPHSFRCAAVEATCGWLAGLYFPAGHGLSASDRWLVEHDPARVRGLDPAEHLPGFAPLPLLALHSDADKLIPAAVQREFLRRLGDRWASAGASRDLIEFRTWTATGAPLEHVGFGKFSNDAKNVQTAFLARHLGAAAAF